MKMEKIFVASKHLIFQLIYLVFPVVVSLFLLYWTIETLLQQEAGGLAFEPIVLLSLFLFIAYRTIRAYQLAQYRIDDEYLYYECGFNKGKIKLASIKSIKLASYPAAGVRPALDMRGVQIIHGEGYSLFISPENRESFIQYLQEKTKSL